MSQTKDLELAASQRLMGRQLERFDHVSEKLPQVEGLIPLAEIKADILEQMASIRNRKRLLLKKLIYLWNNWHSYTESKEMEMYRGEPGLLNWLEEHLEQHTASSYADLRIVRMLMNYKAAQLLDDGQGIEGKLNSLKRIAYLNNKKDPEAAEDLRKELLYDLPKLSNEDVQRRVDEFNRSKGVATEVLPKVRRSWRIASTPSRGKLIINEMSATTTKTIARFLQLVDEEQLGGIVENLERQAKQNKQPQLA